MRIHNCYIGIEGYTHLPKFSKLVLEHHLDNFCEEQLKLYAEINLPLLKKLSHFSPSELFEIVKESMVEFLEYLSKNKTKELIEVPLQRWRNDELGVIGKFEIMAEDINLVNYVRGKVFRKFIPYYTDDTIAAIELIDEIDGFLMVSNIVSTNNYITMLGEELVKHERNLVEAQRIAHIGSFERDLVNDSLHNSQEFYRIFDIKKDVQYDKFLQFVHPDDRDRVSEAVEQALLTGSYECEYRFVKDKKLKHIWSKEWLVLMRMENLLNFLEPYRILPRES